MKPHWSELCRSPWFKLGFFLQVVGGFGILFFIVDARCLHGRFVFALCFNDGIDGLGLAFTWIWRSIGFLIATGAGCYAIAYWMIERKGECATRRRNLPRVALGD
jgi:hypothetical protein